MESLFNEKTLDSSENLRLVAIHKAKVLNSPVVAYHVVEGNKRHIFAVGNHAAAALSAAEQLFEDKSSKDFYEHPAFLLKGSNKSKVFTGK